MYETILCSVGNPDRGQYVSPSLPRKVKTRTLKEASAACRDYILDWNLGGGNWCGNAGKVFLNKTHVANIAYNGKIFSFK